MIRFLLSPSALAWDLSDSLDTGLLGKSSLIIKFNMLETRRLTVSKYGEL